MILGAPARSLTKTVTIDRPAPAVINFLADPMNWPKWAVVNVFSIEPTEDPQWWSMDTRQGPARLSIRGHDVQSGILDHDFVDEQTSWRVPVRVVPNNDGAIVMMTFLQPPDFTDTHFDEQMALMDKEFEALKQILESSRD